jgi:toxin HigB-1
MEVFFSSKKLADLIHDQRKCQRKFGADNAKLIMKRLDNLRFVSNLEEMNKLPGDIHELRGDRAGTCAIDLKHGYRLILEPAENPPPLKVDGGLDRQAITSVVIVDVENYHD